MNTAFLLMAQYSGAAIIPKTYRNKATERSVQWAKNNPERTREIKREWRKRNPRSDIARRNASPLKQMVNSTRYSARRRGLEFSITDADLKQVEFCPVLGIKLDWSHGSKGKIVPGSPSIDRIDNSKGYVAGNVQVISFRANAIKGVATLQEMRAIVRYMESGLMP